MAEPNMVEMVVAALVSFNLDDQAPDYNETLRKAARAAIAAMRKPTARMRSAASDKDGIDDNGLGCQADVTVTWPAMIDAALSEDKK